MMKKIFFIVSALGAMYLAYQSMGANWFSAGPQNTVVEQQTLSKEQAEPDTNNSVAQLAGMSSRLEALEQENQALQAQLKQSEQNEQRLQSELAHMNTANLEAQNRSNDIDNRLARANKPIAAIEVGTVPDLVTVTDNKQTEQQKRLTQQAQLRDVAQRMQLAALNALNSSSR
jgi:septal ring factor EnvC (AmiA/AmiB activator)